MKPVIAAHNLGKMYQINQGRGSSLTLREAVMELIAKPARWLREISTVGRAVPQSLGDEFWALKEVSFEINPGDTVAIIGKNGSGKSTLLKILSRIVEPTTGFAEINGRVGSLLEVGTGFHPELTGRENIFLSGSIIGMSKAEIVKKFDSIVDFSGVEKFLDTTVKHYSSGMYVRLGFSVASHLDPEILLVDEVLAVGDAIFQKKCLEKMREVTRQGRTVLFVSHNVNALTSLCNKGILLEEGKLLQTETLDECLNLYVGASRNNLHCWSGNIGDENIRLYQVKFDRVLESKNLFCKGESFLLAIEYEVLRYDPRIVVGVDIFSASGVFLCATRLTDILRSDALLSIQKKGVHHVSVDIDTGIFSDGDYLIKCNFGLHGAKRIIEEEPILSFKIINPGRNLEHDTPLYTNIIYPDWHWTFDEKVSLNMQKSSRQ